MKKINKSGSKFGRLLVVSEIGSFIQSGRSRVLYLCKCDCGKEVKVFSDQLGRNKSCGCLRSEKIGALNYKHGEAKKTKENKAWFAIKDRCYNKNAEKYPIYGGRGIIVCDRWLNSYEDFLSDIGRAPTPKHSIDRIDVNGNYTPKNCKWATPKEQANNTRTNVLLTLNNTTLNLKQWAEWLGYEYKYFHSQIRYKNKTLEQLAHGRF